MGTRLVAVICATVLVAGCTSNDHASNPSPAALEPPARTNGTPSTDPAAEAVCDLLQEIASINDVKQAIPHAMNENPTAEQNATYEALEGDRRAAARRLIARQARLLDPDFAEAVEVVATMAVSGRVPPLVESRDIPDIVARAITGCDENGHPLHGVSLANLPW